MYLYEEYIRSIRIGDFDLYIYCLPKLAGLSLIFALNHQNYVRCLVRYGNLLKLSETHPEVHQDFQKGCFAIKWKEKDFSTLPSNLILEQTINADAASQKTGINSLTNSIGARERWARSHFLRNKIISYVFDKVGMSKKEAVTQDLWPKT